MTKFFVGSRSMSLIKRFRNFKKQEKANYITEIFRPTLKIEILCSPPRPCRKKKKSKREQVKELKTASIKFILSTESYSKADEFFFIFFYFRIE